MLLKGDLIHLPNLSIVRLAETSGHLLTSVWKYFIAFCLIAYFLSFSVNVIVTAFLQSSVNIENKKVRQYFLIR